MTEDRYYQPQNAKDALRYIEGLFNQYAQAPLTMELVAYHQKLVKQIQEDVLPTAEKEGQPAQVENAKQMLATMQSWLRIRMSGQPFAGKMHHFKFEADNAKPKFKRKIIKGRRGGNHRSVRH
ncbi:hypothetical protein [Secundilactobacillus silagei]|uniref:Uncharacterized protein n=2 Tax=Secundilactobacillus silagei TaxID=1293415 RepID=A0A1Z5H3V9_9LACO|nr:hypothetical protein [Secundilactobacillus silagei]TDG70376.1 hypothetical protein C5L25_001566 [Secundilactobacillus silagei JCM 19001]GAT17852.1 hypothetical protein IWT126_00109 [Secundilactobacillus silagei JCM 19001]